MDSDIGNIRRIRPERGGRGGGSGSRMIRRGAARNMTLKGGTAEASGKFRNRTWRRDGVASQGDAEHEAAGGAENRDERPSTLSAFGSFASSNASTPLSTNGKGVNGLTHAPPTSDNTSIFGSDTSGANPFGAPTSNASMFLHSAFQTSSSGFTTSPTSSLPKRNAFGALIDSGPGQPISVFGQPTSQPPTSTSTFGTFSQPFSNSNPPSAFGTTSLVPESHPRTVSALNASAAEFKPGSAFTTSNAFSTASAFPQAFTSSTPTSTSGSTSNSRFGTPQSSFPTSFGSSHGTGTPSHVAGFAKSAFSSPKSNIPPGKDTIRALAPSQRDVLAQSTHASPISASAREGGHISTSGFRFKHRPRWKTHDGPSTSTTPRPLQKDAPPYRVPPDVQREIDRGGFATDSRFPGNRFLELKALRPSMRAHSIKHKLISDPEHRTDLTGAITVVGTCMDMCPEFERHEREFQKDVDDWEKISGTNPKRIDHARAVKKYRRSAAGNDEPLESDLRPPDVLKMTLDYLFYELLDKHGLESTYAFIRDRTRAIRTDFTIQHEKGPIAIECFERIARFHILAVHRFCERDDVRGFDYWQEVEQMMKTLQSLMQFYDDNEGKLDSPNEAEFRSYYILAHIRDTNSMRRLQSLAPQIFLDPVLQTAIEFRSYAQRNTHLERRAGNRAAKLKFRNSEACQNAFTRFFKRVRDEGTSYLMGCLLEYHFGGVRKGAIHSLWKAYTARHRPFPTADLMEFLGLDDEDKTLEVAKRFGMVTVTENGEVGGTAAVQLNKNSKFDYANQMSQRHSITLVEAKVEDFPDVEIVDGRFEKAGVTWSPSRSEAAPSTLFASAPPEQTTQITRQPSGVQTGIPPIKSAPTSFSPSFGQWPSVPTTFTNQDNSTPQGVEHNLTPLGNPVAPPPPISSAPDLTSFATSTFTSPFNPFPSQASASASSFWSNAPEVAPSKISLPTQRTESVFTPPLREPPPLLQPTQPDPEQQSPVIHPPVPAETPGLPPTELIENADAPLPAVPKAPSPRPTQEELLYEQKQELLRASALAQAKADRHYKFKTLLIVFTHWKRNVMNRGHIRLLREEQEAQFRRSIKEMGLSTTSPAGDKKGKQKAVLPEEDLVPWEDTSQASSSSITRRRSRKSVKRADDDATLLAIKEAEAVRIKLWEPGTFLSSVVRRVQEESPKSTDPPPPGWQIWLSTTADNASTAEWLRLKFGADASTASTTIPGLDTIHLSQSRDLPAGHTFTAGIIVFDSSTLVHARASQTERRRLSSLMSLLPMDRHYVPSVLLFHWNDSVALPDDISSSLDDLQRENNINAWRTLTFANDGRHFDDQFFAGLQQLPLDTVGKLVEKVSIDDIYKMFLLPWDTALDQGINTCQLYESDDFDWVLYGKLLSVMLSYINRLAGEVLRICNIESPFELLPPFDDSHISDQLSAFNYLIEYLAEGWMAENPDASLLRMELSADQLAGRDFYIRAVPERLAHLVLCKLREYGVSTANFFMDIKEPPSSVMRFTESLNASLTQLERRFPSSPSKKRMASEEYERPNASSRSGFSRPKRRKHDSSTTMVNGISPQSSASNGHLPKQDPLARLRATIANARRSVEDLRLERDADQSFSPPNSETDTWSPTRDVFSPELPSRGSPTRSERMRHGHTSSSFTLKPDVDLPLIPLDAFEVIPAKSAHALMPPETHFPPISTVKTKNNGPVVRYHPYSDGRGRDCPPTTPMPSPARMHGAASLTPRASELESKSTGGNLAKLKENLQRAQRAVEQSRRAREESEGA